MFIRIGYDIYSGVKNLVKFLVVDLVNYNFLYSCFRKGNEYGCVMMLYK